MSRRRKILTFVAVALGVAIVLAWIHHLWLRQSTKAYIAQLKAQGVPLELAQVMPPPVPPDQNAAPLITNALAHIYYLATNDTNAVAFHNPPYDMNRTIPGKEMLGWCQPVIHSPDNWPRNLTNTWDELGAQLAERQGDFNDFRKLIEKSTLGFHVNYSDTSTLGWMSHLPQLKLAAQWLLATEFYDLHQGKTADACTDVRCMLAFVRGETNERFEISQLVRFAITSISAYATWNILQATNVSGNNLAQLQHDWESLEFIAPLRNAFLFERVNESRQLHNLQQSPKNFWQWFASVYTTKGYRIKQIGEGSSAHWEIVDKSSFPKKIINKISTAWNRDQWRLFWSYPNEVRALKMWQTVIDGTQMLETNRCFPSVKSFVNANLARQGFGSVQHDPFAVFSWNAASQLGAISKLAIAVTIRNTVITAIALKRYELQQHHLPTTLDALVPEFLKSVPTDYMNGRPLHYQLKTDGTFLLYSVGLNGKDDGGNPALVRGAESSDYYWLNPKALDWVWPQPATPEEIQQYYDRHSKDSAD